jgi:glycosyltransferase involved in cell wall biosynthesis
MAAMKYPFTERPFVTIVIPTLNRYDYLRDVLLDLEKQDYPHFEVVVCDQSDSFNESFYKGWKLDIKLIRQEEKALWLARNKGIINARGKFIALTEDDVRLPITWLSNHLKCIYYFNVDISCGIFYKEGSIPTFALSYFRFADFFATGNTLLKKDVFNKVGLFDRQFEKQRMGDGEFGLRCFLNGYRLIQNPLAYCEDVKAPVGGLRDFGSWDSFRVKGLFTPRPVPSVFYFVRYYFGATCAVFYALQNIPFSFVPYSFKKNRWLKSAAFLFFPLLLPVMIIVALRSWHQSSKKLSQGPKIEILF